MTRKRRVLIWSAIGALVVALGGVLLWRHPFGWPGLEQASWAAGLASGVLALVSAVAAILALRSPSAAPPSSGPPAESHYLRQVQALAPGSLLDRDRELGELAAFCAGGDSAYGWWQAPAWAGKTALMTSFALHPPPGVRIVAFFITARYAGQSDRVAFTDVVLEQLSEILGRPIPSYLTDATRDAHFRGMLVEAADACRARGERLLLLVDGLDEDRGLSSPDIHSIAALLPSQPPPGLRIVLAGRADRPIPADVPGHHPLRDPAIVRLLSPSPHATVVRVDAEGELKRLVSGVQTGRDVLALLTVAGGGLTVADIAELIGRPGWEIEDQLHASSGRMFIRRPGRWRSDPAYVLGHEELRRGALTFLEPAVVHAGRQRLQAWSTGYRTRGWPPETPEYLLRDLFWNAYDARDAASMCALATDPRRHERLRQISGGDALALAEVGATLDLVTDFEALGRLAVHRADLADRSRSVPRALPALWVRLGNIPRAAELARSIAADDQRAWALSAVADELVKVGVTADAAAFAAEAATLVEHFTEPDEQVWATAVVVNTLAITGSIERAERIARAIVEPDWRGSALAAVGRATAVLDESRAGRLLAEAAALAGTTAEPDFRMWALAKVAMAAAASGANARAASIAEQAAAVRHPAGEAFVKPWALGNVAQSLVAAGLLGRAEELAQSVDDPASRAFALAAVAMAVAATGDLDHAGALATDAGNVAETVGDHADRIRALAAVVGALSAAGDVGQSSALLGRIETLALADPGWEAGALLAVAQAAAELGELPRASLLAEQVVTADRSSEARYRNACTLASFVVPLHVAGEPARSAVLAGRAVEVARSLANPNWQAHALIEVASALAGVGEADQVESIVRSIADREWRDRALTAAVEASVVAHLVDRAETFLSEISDRNCRARALALSAANTAEPRGRLDQAGSLTASALEPDRAALLAIVAACAAEADLGRATSITIADPDWRAEALTTVVEAAAGTAGVAALERIARSIDDPGWQARALAAVSAAEAARGDTARAVALAESIGDMSWQARSLAAIADHLGDEDLADRAEEIALCVVDADQQAETLGALAAGATPPRADRLTRRAIRLGHWRFCVDVLARDHPVALVAMADTVLDLSA